MQHISLTVLACLGVAAFAQEVQFDYNRSANFSAYKTYQWVDFKPVDVGDQILDQDIKRAVDAQLAGKGLRRVESGGDLHVGYQAGISQEKQFNGSRVGGALRVGRRALGRLEQRHGNVFDYRHWQADRSGSSTRRQNNSSGAAPPRRRSISRRILTRTTAISRRPWPSCSETIRRAARAKD